MLVRLHDLLTAPRAVTDPVCVDGDAAIGWGVFTQCVQQAAASLSRQAPRRWLLCLDDTFEFACGLFALMAAGKHVVIPSNTLAANRQELLGSFDAVLDDLRRLHESDPALEAGLEPALEPAATAFYPMPQIDPAAPISLYTSGSTGAPKEIRKTLAQFDAEVAALEACWGAEIDACTILASVPHHHIYGLLFRLFWPLAAGRPFAREACRDAAQLREQLAAHPVSALVSSPAHLTRWPQLLDLAQLTPAPRIIFSSGGPLSVESAHGYAAVLGRAPVEIFGSTETGGIAWRTQEVGVSAAWRPLPGVQIRREQDGALGVRSPHLADAAWWRCDDAVEIDATGDFILRGRLDRTVKVQDKRVSLPAVEQFLGASAWVNQAAVVLLAGASAADTASRGKIRDRLGAVVALNEAGIAMLRESGRIGLIKQLRRHLAERYDAVLLPRHWRFRTVLPTDERGKLPERVLLALFADEISAREPVLLSEVRQGHEVLLDLQVRHDLVYFAGHFPGFPILPGVVQIDWAARAVQRYFPGLPAFRALDNIKFTAPVGPGAMLRLTLVLDEAQSRVQFAYRMQDRNCATGRFVYGDGR